MIENIPELTLGHYGSSILKIREIYLPISSAGGNHERD
jgi:hypothetical protein